ncbi:VanZ like family protein [Blastococcus aurantiacus]|uniref:VanZ like family protein n=1 Tax=Blastococcus aurantiacus TaxID=1550231 RepID=A0A1G7IZ92_9ACTN|nr:VanZ family protein [Blastococcus aurantiacus]SDF17938.1 VanZ like family protein [Blastococcus aurantiacus]
MITDFLLDHSALVPGALGLAALVCALVGHAVLRVARPGSPVIPALAVVAAVGVLVLTMPPTGRGASIRGCTVQFAWPGPGSVELLANVALLMPVVVFATLATRRPWAVLGAGSGASAAIEAVQALVPAIGRACDTNDWAMNTLGVVVATGIAGATLALADRAAARRGDGTARTPIGTAR